MAEIVELDERSSYLICGRILNEVGAEFLRDLIRHGGAIPPKIGGIPMNDEEIHKHFVDCYRSSAHRDFVIPLNKYHFDAAFCRKGKKKVGLHYFAKKAYNFSTISASEKSATEKRFTEDYGSLHAHKSLNEWDITVLNTALTFWVTWHKCSDETDCSCYWKKFSQLLNPPLPSVPDQSIADRFMEEVEDRKNNKFRDASMHLQDFLSYVDVLRHHPESTSFQENLPYFLCIKIIVAVRNFVMHNPSMTSQSVKDISLCLKACFASAVFSNLKNGDVSLVQKYGVLLDKIVGERVGVVKSAYFDKQRRLASLKEWIDEFASSEGSVVEEIGDASIRGDAEEELVAHVVAEDGIRRDIVAGGPSFGTITRPSLEYLQSLSFNLSIKIDSGDMTDPEEKRALDSYDFGNISITIPPFAEMVFGNRALMQGVEKNGHSRYLGIDVPDGFLHMPFFFRIYRDESKEWVIEAIDAATSEDSVAVYRSPSLREKVILYRGNDLVQTRLGKDDVVVFGKKRFRIKLKVECLLGPSQIDKIMSNPLPRPTNYDGLSDF